MYRYTVQCTHSISGVDDGEVRDLMWVRYILFVWFAGLAVILALNALFTIIVGTVSFLHGFRKMILHKFVKLNIFCIHEIIIMTPCVNSTIARYCNVQSCLI